MDNMHLPFILLGASYIQEKLRIFLFLYLYLYCKRWYMGYV